MTDDLEALARDIANRAVDANLNNDGKPVHGTSQGYACAMEAVRLANTERALPDREATIDAAKTLSAEELRSLCADAMRADGVSEARMTITDTGVVTSFSYDNSSSDAIAQTQREAYAQARAMLARLADTISVWDYQMRRGNEEIAAAIRSLPDPEGDT